MLFYDLLSNAKKRNIQVNIGISDIKNLYNKQTGLCVLSKFKLTWIKYPNDSPNHINNKFNISVDRIDSNKDYSIDNIQLVCAAINIMKSSIDSNKFIDICKKITINNNLIPSNFI
jgi:hypothetical protein